MAKIHNATHPVNREYVAALSVANAIEKHLGGRVTLHVNGTTWEGAPSFAVELPCELYEAINERNAADLTSALCDLVDRLTAILASPKNGD
jgi:hypothetical protein